ncbi:MAG: hypothetical protein GX117_04815 [Candidatus Hydrogenedentes bacterium]|jgi:hypothetical protein|nr:hypothetical protein [Candidatus Hydrogenedentota bacterium]
MSTALEIVPASDFFVQEDDDLYYISLDGQQAIKSDLIGTKNEVVATIDQEGRSGVSRRMETIYLN